MPVTAVQHVRRMRGGAQSHLMRCSDGNFYVVKFQNNPQHVRVLANELVATRLAAKVGLPVPVPEIVEVSEWLVRNTPELTMQVAGEPMPCMAGLQFGSRYVVDPLEGQFFDYLPEAMLARVKNLGDFAGMLAFDKWTCNVNGRQVVFWKKSRERRYAAAFIDHGYCFNAGEWTWADAPLRGVYARNAVYAEVRGWMDFDPWIYRIEEMAPEAVREAAEDVPPEWYGGDFADLERLVEGLIARRGRVRELIEEFRKSNREPFPKWV